MRNRMKNGQEFVVDSIPKTPFVIDGETTTGIVDDPADLKDTHYIQNLDECHN